MVQGSKDLQRSGLPEIASAREIVQKSQGDHSMYTTICSIIQLMQQLN
jgi:hypothetical protein